MSMFPELPDVASLVEKRREFSEERILGYSPEGVYDVVADLNRYKEFLPWCQESRYIREGPERSYGQLSIGIPPLLERYTAMVLHSRPTAIRTIATDGTLFTSLENHWQFRPGPPTDAGPTCLVNFWVMFEFRSIVYAKLGNIVFDEVARSMAASFERRCEALYGPSHLPTRGRSFRNRLHPTRTKRINQCSSMFCVIYFSAHIQNE
ncbi:Coenzyme Q-binding protein COQ10 homolog A, mitochondrial [Geodia barretti]|nr:Coenzyme Q-binding protein COQ10 homolog A, mitochondrial [Geodia barretti]